MSYKKLELLTLRVHLDSPPIFDGVRVAHLSLVFCVVFFVLFVFLLCLVCPMLPVSLDCLFLIAPCFVCLHPVSCVTNVASFSGLSIIDYLFGFL